MLGPNRFITGGGQPVPRRVTLISCPAAVAGARTVRANAIPATPRKMLNTMSPSSVWRLTPPLTRGCPTEPWRGRMPVGSNGMLGRRCGGRSLIYIGRKESPLSRESLEGMRPTIDEGYTRPSRQLLHGVGHDHLAGLGYRCDADARKYRNAAHGLIVVLNLPGVYADLHRQPEPLHGITDRAPAADGGDGTVKDGKDLLPDHIHLFPAVTGQLLAHERGVLRPQFKPATIAERDEPFSRANHVDEEHCRQNAARRHARAWASTRIQRLQGWEVGRQVRDDELEDALRPGKALEAMHAEVSQAETANQGILDQRCGRF